MSGQLLNVSDVVIENDVGEFMSDVAVSPRGIAAGVAYGDGPAVGQVEGCGREGPWLDLLEFLEASAAYKAVSGDDLDAEVSSEVADVEVIMWLQAHLSPGALGEPLGLGLETASHALPVALVEAAV
jgi:hypothetical protein